MKGKQEQGPENNDEYVEKMTIVNSLATALLVAGTERVADLPNVPTSCNRPRTGFRICL